MIRKRLSRFYQRIRFVLLGLLLAATFQLPFQPIVIGQSTPFERVADTPEAWIESLFLEAPTGIETETSFIAMANDYAEIPYVWGEGGGFVVLAKGEEGWTSACGSGGALDGGDFFVEYCDMNLVDAQALWDAYRTEYEAATGEALQ